MIYFSKVKCIHKCVISIIKVISILRLYININSSHKLSLRCHYFFLSCFLANVDLVAETERHSLRFRTNPEEIISEFTSLFEFYLRLHYLICPVTGASGFETFFSRLTLARASSPKMDLA